VKGKFTEGRPELESLTYADSTDFVTKAGAGGMVLTEAAKPSNPQLSAQIGQLNLQRNTANLTEGGAEAMADAALLQRLQVAEAALRKLNERGAVHDAAGVLAEYFASVRVGEAIQQRVTRRVLAGPLPTLAASGDLDRAALAKLAETETKDEVTYIASLTGRPVTSMGVVQDAELTEAQKLEQRQARERELADSAHLFGLHGKMAGRIFAEGRSAFDPTYNAGEKEAAA
jgi:hypothetical protein